VAFSVSLAYCDVEYRIRCSKRTAPDDRLWFRALAVLSLILPYSDQYREPFKAVDIGTCGLDKALANLEMTLDPCGRGSDSCRQNVASSSRIPLDAMLSPKGRDGDGRKQGRKKLVVAEAGHAEGFSFRINIRVSIL